MTPSSMVERAVLALAQIEGDLEQIPVAVIVRTVLLAALDPEDEALQELWADVIDRFSDPASHHCMATFFAALKAIAQTDGTQGEKP